VSHRTSMIVAVVLSAVGLAVAACNELPSRCMSRTANGRGAVQCHCRRRTRDDCSTIWDDDSLHTVVRGPHGPVLHSSISHDRDQYRHRRQVPTHLSRRTSRRPFQSDGCGCYRPDTSRSSLRVPTHALVSGNTDLPRAHRVHKRMKNSAK